MGTQRFTANEIQGLTPAIEPVQSDKIFALTGRNFVFDSRGPRSIFGNRMLSPIPRQTPAHMQGVRIRFEGEVRSFHIDGDGIWEWIENAGVYRQVYQTPDTTTLPFRWTHAYLNGILFFCHPRVGIICYQILTGEAFPHAIRSSATVNNPLAVAETNGRLCVLTDKTFTWSAPSDGLDFTPALGGAGAQALADRVAGDPIMIMAYPAGCLVWTTAGVLRAEFTGDVKVFRYKQVNTDVTPLNSMCITRIDEDTIVILDERGLYQTKGDTPVPYSPAFNEYLIEAIREYRLKAEKLRIEWDGPSKMLYLSVRLTDYGALYGSAFVLYPDLDKWGRFDVKHYGIFPVELTESTRTGVYLGFADEAGFVRYLLPAPNREVAQNPTTHTTQDLRLTSVTHPMQQQLVDTGFSGGSSLRLTTLPKSTYQYRLSYSQAGVNAPSIPSVVGLDSKIRFGLFRPMGQGSVDEVSEVINIAIGSSRTRDPNAAMEDYETSTLPNEDYETSDEDDEDWGSDEGSVVSYGLTIHSTMDGVDSFMSVVPDLVDQRRHMSYYACSAVGIWHMLEVTATQPNESYHVKSFQLTATSAGKLL